MPAKTTAQKLLIKPGAAFWSSHPEHAGVVGPLPDGVEIVDGPGKADVALVFAADAASARTELDGHRDEIATPPVVWVAYPKGNRSDINRDTLWPIVAEFGLRPNGQVALDDVWSALRFRAYKDGEEPFTGGKTS
jgi:hypothetical protein